MVGGKGDHLIHNTGPYLAKSILNMVYYGCRYILCVPHLASMQIHMYKTTISMCRITTSDSAVEICRLKYDDVGMSDGHDGKMAGWLMFSQYELCPQWPCLMSPSTQVPG